MSHRVKLKSVVARQLPEFVREDYPTFVAFVEAYYDYLQQNSIDLKEVRDLDETLDEYVQYFKKEVAANLPLNVAQDERFLLQHIKDQYLAKGSQASYKLLFRMLYGKNVELTYPGQQMLVASDGRWNQEISVFAQVDYGDANAIVGKLVDIQTPNKILRVLVDKKEEMTGEVDRIVKIGKSYEIASTATAGKTTVTVSTTAGIEVGQLVTGIGIIKGTKVVSIGSNSVVISNATTDIISHKLIYSNEVYEFFLDKNFYGTISSGDKIRFRDEFQASILPATTKLIVSQPGKNFRIGQVFNLQSGSGTGALLKVTRINSDGGIKYAELIKFGLGYTADFAVSILATNSVTSVGGAVAASSTSLSVENDYTSAGAGTVSASASSRTVTGSGTNFGQAGGVAVGDELWTTAATPLLIGVVESITSPTSLTLEMLPPEYRSGSDETGYSATSSISGTYTGSYTFRNLRSVGSLLTYYKDAEHPVQQAYTDKVNIIDRMLGFDEQGYINYADYVAYGYADGAYAGNLAREFSLTYRNAQTTSDEPAVISIKLGALQRYPGYFTTNNGFLSDAIFIQDSKYYQAFSYVVRIDERLSTYKAAVKSMVHPSGMALFGEFNITNTYDLSIALESLVRALGIGLEDELADITDSYTLKTTKAFGTSVLNDGVSLDSNIATMIHSVPTLVTGKSLADTSVGTFSESWTHLTTKGLTESTIGTFTETWAHVTSKALSDSYSGMIDSTYSIVLTKPLADTTVGTFLETVALTTTKPLADTTVGTLLDVAALTTTKSLADNDVGTWSDSAVLNTGKLATDSISETDVITNIDTSKSLTDLLSTPSEALALTTTKYVVDSTIGTFSEAGKVWINSYQAQDYYSETYSVGLSGTFT